MSHNASGSGATPTLDPFSLAGLALEEVFSVLETDPQGLNSEEAQRRLSRLGLNEIREVARTPLIYRFLSQFTHFMALILWVGSGVAFVANMAQLGFAILGVIVINAIFSFWQEYEAERAVEALRRLLPPHALVRRGGLEVEIAATQLVPGDLVLVREGDRISADARLIGAIDLRLDTSVVTGESRPMHKHPEPTPQRPITILEAPNLVFAGTSVTHGSGEAIVFATGMHTQFGQIAHLTQQVREVPSPLQKETNRVALVVAALAVAIGFIFFLLGWFVVHLPLAFSFIFALGIIVANVPEGLLPTVTLSLALGVQRMARRNAIVKRLSSVETLGCATVICTDKTGTITENQMTVRRLWLDGQFLEVSGAGYHPEGAITSPSSAVDFTSPLLGHFLRCAAFCNDARLVPPNAENPLWGIRGDPTEGALLTLATKGGLNLEAEARCRPRRFEHPFDPILRRMATIHQEGEVDVAYVKGAPAEIVARSSQVQTGEGLGPLDEAERHHIMEQNDALARQGLRVLALAYRFLPHGAQRPPRGQVEQELIFLGLAGMEDPPRPEVSEAIQKCHTAGIRIIMITGDYHLTALSIAQEVGMIGTDGVRVITGADLAHIGASELKTALAEEVIITRARPEDKMLVVQALQEMGEIVAVTGDGVNDAPALKKADVGVAMGIEGTDVAKEAADMILTDDNFASIVAAIEEGRAVYENIRKFMTYILASNVPELIPFLAMVFLGIPLPLTVLQILAVDLGTDMLPALALGAEPPEPGAMNRPPRSRRERLLNWPTLARAYGFLGIVEAALSLSGYFFVNWSAGWRPGLELAAAGPIYRLATTMTLAGIVACQVGNVFACRSPRVSAFKIGLGRNRLLLGGIIFELTLISALVYLPLPRDIFGLEPLAPGDWAYLVLFAPTLLLLEEGRKALWRRFRPSR